MNKNNLVPFSTATEEWLINIYQQEFVGLKMYAVRIVRNETDAEQIVGQGFFKLNRELCKNPGKFPSQARAKAYLTTIIKNDCRSWFRKNDRLRCTSRPKQ